MSLQAVSKWERGAGYPDVALLPVIAAYFGVSLDVLLEYDANNTKPPLRIRSVRPCANFGDFLHQNSLCFEKVLKSTCFLAHFMIKYRKFFESEDFL